MIVCGNCGFQNESDDTFCGSCGSFLEWSIEPAPAVAVGAAAGGGRGAVGLASPPRPEVRRQAEAAAEVADRMEETARAEAEAAAKAKAEADARAQAEAEARAKAEAEAQAKAELDRRAQEELKQRAQAEAEGRRRAEEEAKSAKSAADQGKTEAALQARREAELRIRKEAEARARASAEAKAQAEAEARRRAEAEANAKREAERQGQREVAARERARTAEARAAEARAAVLVAPTPVATPSAGLSETDTIPPAGDGATKDDAAPVDVDLTEATPRQVAARRPEAVKPAAARPRPAPVKAPPSREPQLGDLICEQCTEGNLRTRKFCRRCGASLFEAKPFVPPAVAAGERPMLRGGSAPRRVTRADTVRKAAKIGTAVVGVVAVLGPLRAPVARALSGLVRTQEFVQVRPVNAEGPSTPGHEAIFAIDRDTNSYWSQGLPKTGPDAKLTITFNRPEHLDRIGIYSGANDTDFEKQPRPETLKLTFFDANGDTQTRTLEPRLEDKPGEQFRPLKVKHRIAKLTLEILTVYPALGNAGSDASISGLEFFEKQ